MFLDGTGRDPMVSCANCGFLAASRILLLPQACARGVFAAQFSESLPLITNPQSLAVYEAWFGHPAHFHIGDSAQDPFVVQRQIEAKKQRRQRFPG
jgi:hypothetical protein